MEGESVRIITIEKDIESGRSKYELEYNALFNILNKIRNEEVAVISIAGQARQGKSFLLSFLLRYLSNYPKFDWIGSPDEPLTGFKWQNGIEPETQGIWMWSEPIIIKRSINKNLAILIMDTQGVHDEYTDLRDWSTIVGISLLTSSCLILNLFSEIHENILTDFESFLNYGNLALEKNDSNEPVFQKLLFLIRDWNHASHYKYGNTGGRKYLEDKLLIKEKQSESSKRVRKLIKECFEELMCYLMPYPGSDREDKKFNGSISQLDRKFVEKLKEFFPNCLNPEELRPKSINGAEIKGKDLLKYFEIYIEKFNSSKMPMPIDLFQATAKAADYNLVHNLKEYYVDKMYERLGTKQFLTRQELETSDGEVFEYVKCEFQKSKMTENRELEKEIFQTFINDLMAAKKKMYEENDIKKKNAAEKTIIDHIKVYRQKIQEFSKSNYIKPVNFDEVLNQAKKEVINKFLVEFSEEDDEFNDHYKVQIYERLEEEELSLKDVNYKKKSELKRKNLEAVDDSYSYFCDKIATKIEQSILIVPQEFDKYLEDVKKKSMKIFEKNCKKEDSSLKKFEDELQTKLEIKRTEFASDFFQKLKEIIDSTESQFSEALNLYREKMNSVVESLCSEEKIHQSHKDFSNQAFQLFENNCILKDEKALSKYKSKLENEIENCFAVSNQNYLKKIAELHSFYENTIDESINKCFVENETAFDGSCLLSIEELTTIRNSLKEEVVFKYENMEKQGILREIKYYIHEKIANTFDSLFKRRLINNYLKRMSKEVSATNTYLTRGKLTEAHENYKSTALETLRKNIKTLDGESADDLMNEFVASIENSFKGIYSKNEQKREQIVSQQIDESRDFYSEKMSQKLENMCFDTSRFEEMSLELKEDILKKFKLICGEQKDLFDKYFSKISEILTQMENGFRDQNISKLTEAKKELSEAFNQSLSIYTTRMNYLIEENRIFTKESFKAKEYEIRLEATDEFNNLDKSKDLEYMNKLESDLIQKIKNLKEGFKYKFYKNLKALETEIQKQIDIALTVYNDLMSSSINSVTSEAILIEKHEINKNRSTVIFKKNFENANDELISEYTSKLDQEISKNFIKLKVCRMNSLKTSEINYEKIIEDLFSTYLMLMEEETKNYTYIPEEKLKNFHENKVNEIMKEGKRKFGDEKYPELKKRSMDSLEVRIIKEFERIKDKNKKRFEEHEKKELKLELQIKRLIKKYEDIMNEKIEILSNESELKQLHSITAKSIKEELINSNPFNNREVFQPFLKKFEAELVESLKDFESIHKVNLEKHSQENEKLIKDSRKFYKEEMRKYYRNTNFLKAEDLNECNSKVVERALEKFENQSKNISVKDFRKIIKKSLRELYEEIIKENDKNLPNHPAIGIDLGTTNSCVAYFQPSTQKVIIVPNEMGNKTTPSVVAYNENYEEVITGDAAKNRAYSNPRNTIFSAKRLIGRKFSDVVVQKDLSLWPFRVVDDGNDIAKIQVKTNGDEKAYFPEEISAKILKNLKQTAEKHLGCKVKNAVITVPAYFNDSQKEATKDAGAIAGLNVLKIINEPTAAAIAFQLNRCDDEKTKNVLVYDFGGGTFDVVVLTTDRANIIIKAVGGDNHLGGDDIDANIVQHCLHEFSVKNNLNFDRNGEEGEKALRRLTAKCEQHKCELSATNCVTITVDNFYQAIDLSVEMTREKFEELNNEIFEKSIKLVQEVLFDAKLKYEEIDDIVLVGGTTRIPKIQERLSDLFYGKQLNHSVDPDEAVAIGAAIQAAILNGNQFQNWERFKISEVAPMSLGIKVRDGLFSTIIQRNSKVPNKYTKLYETTYKDQTQVEIEIYEGEDPKAINNRKLGTFELSNIPPGPAGGQKFEVTFEINEEGILHVSAKILSTGHSKDIEITEHKGRLSQAELNELIKEQA